MPICLQLSPSSAVLLSGGSERFEEALRLLYGMARTSPDTPTLVEALGIAALGMPYLPTEVPPEARERILKAGRASYYTATHRLEDAELLFKELIQSYPDTPNVHCSYGVFLLAGTPDKALEQFEPEIEISPLHVRARLQIAFEYIGRAEYEAGLSYARKAVALQPASFAARNALGRILLETGSVEEAVKELEESVRRAPDSPECRYALARACQRAGRREEAARERTEFARLDKVRRGLAEESQPTGPQRASQEERPRGMMTKRESARLSS